MSDGRSRARVPPLPRDAAALAVFGALTLVMTNPLVLHLATAVEDKRDALLNTWIIAWVGHALATDPLGLYHANIFYPYPNTLAFSETLLPQGLFALPINLAFGNTILGYNLVLLGSLLLAAYAMYLLVLDLTGSRGAALVAGAIFAFDPYNLGNLAQVQLLSFGWMPLALLYLRRLLRRADESKPASAPIQVFVTRDSILFALFFALQALSSFYFAFFAGLIVLLYVIWEFVLGRSTRSGLAQLLAPGVLIAVVVVPFLVPYLEAQREQGFQRTLEDSESFSASLNMYTQVSPQNVLYGGALAPRPPILRGDYPLDNLFPGLVALGLAVVALAASRKRDRWFLVFLLAIAFLLSLGPRLFIT
ncbi:MAG: hypothetical protein M1482_01505, partial [Chloroflexi bacterium]|nr:hypothetical protein [Chloroflexota bacterium]